MENIREFTLEPENNERLARVCGVLDENLQRIEDTLQVKISRRGARFSIAGEQADRAASMLKQMYARADQDFSGEDIQLGLVEAASSTSAPVSAAGQLQTRRSNLHGRTPRQVQYLNQMQEFDITFGIGPAGTGKTYLAVASAVDAFERDRVERIILTRPAVEAGERLGFLPGDLAQKVDPYLRPLYDALYDLMGFDRVGKLFERGSIEVAPLAFMRGRTLNNAFIILDEAQNTTPEQMKMFLTRIGFGAKAVVTGDLTQIDLPRGNRSGLVEASEILASVPGIAFTYFQKEDVVRHPLVARIVEAYDNHSAKKASLQEKDHD